MRAAQAERGPPVQTLHQRHELQRTLPALQPRRQTHDRRRDQFRPIGEEEEQNHAAAAAAAAAAFEVFESDFLFWFFFCLFLQCRRST